MRLNPEEKYVIMIMMCLDSSQKWEAALVKAFGKDDRHLDMDKILNGLLVISIVFFLSAFFVYIKN